MNEAAPPYLPPNDLVMEASQEISGIVTLTQDMAEVGLSRDSLRKAVMSIFPLPHTRPFKEPWPIGSTDDPEPLQSMPQLGPTNRASEASYFHLPAMTDATFGNLLQAVAIPTTYPPWPMLSLENFPTGPSLDECIDLYFAKFHPVSTLEGILRRKDMLPDLGAVFSDHSSPKLRRQQAIACYHDRGGIDWRMLFGARRCPRLCCCVGRAEPPPSPISSMSDYASIYRYVNLGV